MKTGFVTTTRMSHATPGALYSKTSSRFWECENDIRDDIADGNISQEDYDKYKVHMFTRMMLIIRNLIIVLSAVEKHINISHCTLQFTRIMLTLSPA